LLRELKERGERHSGHGDQGAGSQAATPVLADLGITRDQASRWDKLAAIPKEEFETAVKNGATLSVWSGQGKPQ